MSEREGRIGIAEAWPACSKLHISNVYRWTGEEVLCRHQYMTAASSPQSTIESWPTCQPQNTSRTLTDTPSFYLLGCIYFPVWLFLVIRTGLASGYTTKSPATTNGRQRRAPMAWSGSEAHHPLLASIQKPGSQRQSQRASTATEQGQSNLATRDMRGMASRPPIKPRQRLEPARPAHKAWTWRLPHQASCFASSLRSCLFFFFFLSTLLETCSIFFYIQVSSNGI